MYAKQGFVSKQVLKAEHLNHMEDGIDMLCKNTAYPIIDTSAKAAAHELHAQRGPLAVTMYGKTTETGTGEKSPDNPYVISGVDAAQMHAGGKNLFDISKVYSYLLVDGKIRINGTAYNVDIYSSTSGLSTAMTDAVRGNLMRLCAGKYTITFDIAHDDANVTEKRLVICEVNPDNTIGDKYNASSGETITINRSGPVTIRKASSGGATISNLMITPGTEVFPYEPYNANVITSPLLPDGSPLHGNGTVDDTVENDVLSGCDKRIVLDGTQNPTYETGWAAGAWVFYGSTPTYDKDAAKYFCDKFPNSTTADTVSKGTKGAAFVGSSIIIFLGAEYDTADKIKAHLATNPLTVYYRSTEYTPDKDLRVCKTVRNWTIIELDETAVLNTAAAGYYHYGGGKLPASASGTSMVNSKKEQKCNIAIIENPDGGDQTAYYAWAVNGSIRMTKAVGDAVLAGTPMRFMYRLATPETYMTDPLDLRKPYGMEAVTVTGSAETAVTYPHETKHYIDSQIAAAVALALNG